MTATPTLFAECPVPKCSNPVDDGEPCGECVAEVSAGYMRQAPPAEPKPTKAPAVWGVRVNEVGIFADRHGSDWWVTALARWELSGRALCLGMCPAGGVWFLPGGEKEDAEFMQEHIVSHGVLPGRVKVTTRAAAQRELDRRNGELAAQHAADELAKTERAAAQDRGDLYKRGQTCWVCEDRRSCRLDPDQPDRWICKECEAIQL